jgi:hypothetical protein
MDGLIGLSVRIITGFCEHANEPSELISDEDCFQQLSYCQFLKKNSAACRRKLKETIGEFSSSSVANTVISSNLNCTNKLNNCGTIYFDWTLFRKISLDFILKQV